ETAQALFQAVYAHWAQLPEDRRPKLYLHGLSLGAVNSEQSFHLHDVLGDPIQGALWAGPPFRSRVWNIVTRNRRPDSPQWLPKYRDESIVRFMNQYVGVERPGIEWGPLRVVYLQHASDPVSFFSIEAAWREPDWMRAARAGHLAGAALVSAGHHAATRRRHGGRRRGRAARLRPSLLRARVHRSLACTDRARRLADAGPAPAGRGAGTARGRGVTGRKVVHAMLLCHHAAPDQPATRRRTCRGSRSVDDGAPLAVDGCAAGLAVDGDGDVAGHGTQFDAGGAGGRTPGDRRA